MCVCVCMCVRVCVVKFSVCRPKVWRGYRFKEAETPSCDVNVGMCLTGVRN